MKTIFLISSTWILGACFLSPGATAQPQSDPEAWYQTPSSMHGKTVIIPAGTTLEGRIDSTIGSSLSHPGDSFTITIASPVLSNGTDVIIPSGAKVLAEVVEAIPSSTLPRQKNMPKPKGKLRIQLHGLRTPDGQSYPLVASIIGETINAGNREMPNQQLGTGVAYMGTAAGFETVAPGHDTTRQRSSRSPHVVQRQQMLQDPIYGVGNTSSSYFGQQHIRSLVQRGNDLCIMSNSPLTMRLDAPFKIGFNPAGAGGAPMNNLGAEPDYESGRMGKRFSRTRNGPAESLPPLPDARTTDSGTPATSTPKPSTTPDSGQDNSF